MLQHGLKYTWMLLFFSSLAWASDINLMSVDDSGTFDCGDPNRPLHAVVKLDTAKMLMAVEGDNWHTYGAVVFYEALPNPSIANWKPERRYNLNYDCAMRFDGAKDEFRLSCGLEGSCTKRRP